MNRIRILSSLAVLGFVLVACSKPPPDDADAGAVVSAAVAQTESADVMRKWSQSCALCHVTGAAGAPMVGDVAAWAPRLAQGKGVLLKHTIKGYNSMPPLGYCMSCEEEDFSAMIDFMAGESQ